MAAMAEEWRRKEGDEGGGEEEGDDTRDREGEEVAWCRRNLSGTATLRPPPIYRWGRSVVAV